MGTQGVVLVFCVIVMVVSSDSSNKNSTKVQVNSSREFVGKMLETGRTLVQNTLKRFMPLLPAIFFKLGIAFTMLLLVTIVSVNNGFIGFLLLVVGLSSVLARLQENRKPAVVPYVNQVPVYQTKYIQDWDRKDKGEISGVSQGFSQVYGQYGYPQLSAYYRQNS